MCCLIAGGRGGRGVRVGEEGQPIGSSPLFTSFQGNLFVNVL